MITFSNVSIGYTNHRVLEKLDFCIPSKQIVGLVGPNGSGKTTMIKTILGLLYPLDGKISIQDSSITLSPISNTLMSYIPDESIFFDELTLGEHLSFLQTLQHADSDYINHLIKILELKDHLTKMPSILSKGTKQKAMIAFALLKNKDIIIADEPFNGLDPLQIRILKELFVQEKENGRTVILSTHLLDLAEIICDSYLLINKGSILHIESGNKSSKTIEEIYLETHRSEEYDESGALS